MTHQEERAAAQTAICYAAAVRLGLTPAGQPDAFGWRAALARYLGVSRPLLSMWTRGTREIPARQRARLMQATPTALEQGIADLIAYDAPRCRYVMSSGPGALVVRCGLPREHPGKHELVLRTADWLAYFRAALAEIDRLKSLLPPEVSR